MVIPVVGPPLRTVVWLSPPPPICSRIRAQPATNATTAIAHRTLFFISFENSILRKADISMGWRPRFELVKDPGEKLQIPKPELQFPNPPSLPFGIWVFLGFGVWVLGFGLR